MSRALNGSGIAKGRKPVLRLIEGGGDSTAEILSDEAITEVRRTLAKLCIMAERVNHFMDERPHVMSDDRVDMSFLMQRLQKEVDQLAARQHGQQAQLRLCEA
jgi:hypothetical protein